MSTQGNSKVLSIAVVGLILTNICLLCFMFFRKPHHDGPPPFPPEGMNGPGMNQQAPPDRLIQELNFSEEQKISFLKLRDAHRQIIRECKNKNFRDDFFSQLKNGDEIKANAMADSIASTQKKIEMATFNHFKEVRNLCNEKQKEHFDLIIGDVLRMMGRPPRPNENGSPR
jgi:hypothetical protein